MQRDKGERKATSLQLSRLVIRIPCAARIPSWFEFIRRPRLLGAFVRRVLRVSGSGLKSHCASAPVPPEPLQPVRHGKIERMNGEPIALPDRGLLQFERFS
jgi:hypothetical protein